MVEYLEAGLLVNLPSGRTTTVTVAGKDVALYNGIEPFTPLMIPAYTPVLHSAVDDSKTRSSPVVRTEILTTLPTARWAACQAWGRLVPGKGSWTGTSS